MRDFRDLKISQKGYALTLAVYKATAEFPRAEQLGLTSQLRRACTSIPANIAEGCGRTGAAELARFVQIAMGSASELECELMLAQDLGYLHDAVANELVNRTTEVKRMLTSFVRKLQAES